VAVVTYAQRLRAAQLRPARPAWLPLSTRIGWNKGPTAQAAVWDNYFFPIVNATTKPQRIRTTWLANLQPAHSPLDTRIGWVGGRNSYAADSAAWNDWFFFQAYTPLFRYVLSANTVVYSYVAESAFLIFPIPYLIIGAPVDYDWDVGFAHADFGVNVDSIIYSYAVEAATLSPGHSYGALRGPILTTSTRIVQGPKRVSEVVAPAFDFTAKTVVGDVLSAPTVTISVWTGVDPNPQLVYGGSSTINGLVINPVLTGGVAGVIYQVKVTVNSLLAGILTIDSYLVVLPDSL